MTTSPTPTHYYIKMFKIPSGTENYSKDAIMTRDLVTELKSIYSNQSTVSANG